MQKHILALFLFCFLKASYGQITFEKGYFINNVGKKKECLIKNVDWSNNPEMFVYKFSNDDTAKNMSILNSKEFGIYGYSKYLRAKVDVDMSSPFTDDMSNQRQPEFKTKTVYLRVLNEGSSNLYYYQDEHIKRYFLNIDGEDTFTPLIYKIYSKNYGVAYNNDFRVQLMNALKCESLKKTDFEFLVYNQKALSKIFNKYNHCINPDKATTSHKKDKKFLLNFAIKGGLRNSTLQGEESVNFGSVTRNFTNETNAIFGIELEHILNFNKNKWAISLEALYQTYNSKITIETQFSTFEDTYEVDYSSFELGLGLKHFMFLNKNSKLYASSYVITDLPTNTKVNIQRGTGPRIDLELVPNFSFSLGFGYRYLDKYGIELRYHTTRSSSDTIWISRYKANASLLLSYSIF